LEIARLRSAAEMSKELLFAASNPHEALCHTITNYPVFVRSVPMNSSISIAAGQLHTAGGCRDCFQGQSAGDLGTDRRAAALRLLIALGSTARRSYRGSRSQALGADGVDARKYGRCELSIFREHGNLADRCVVASARIPYIYALTSKSAPGRWRRSVYGTPCQI